METGTDTYWVQVDQADRESVRLACAVLLQILSPILTEAWIDAISDYPATVMDEDALEALGTLRARADKRGRERIFTARDNLVGLDLDLTNAEDRQLLRAFGPWSIHAEALSSEREPLIGASVLCFHDSGWDITADLTQAEYGKAVSLLPPRAQLSRLEPKRRRGIWRRSK